MHMILKGAAVALALAGAAFATAGTATAQGMSIGISDNGRHHNGSAVMFSFGDVAYGYRDGYWDNDHRWHHWRNHHDRDSYRQDHGDNYRHGYHHRYRGQGWRRD